MLQGYRGERLEHGSSVHHLLLLLFSTLLLLPISSLLLHSIRQHPQVELPALLVGVAAPRRGVAPLAPMG